VAISVKVPVLVSLSILKPLSLLELSAQFRVIPSDNTLACKDEGAVGSVTDILFSTEAE
jgi:hypothetical protein